MGRKNFAFTLIELMIVVAFIGLMSVLVIVSLQGSLWKGNDAKRKSDLDRIKIALEEYEKDHSCYPKASDMALCGIDASIAIHPYLANVPCDPITKQAYYYEPDPNSPQCPDWFRLYGILQNTKDISAIAGIGLNSAYNFYVRSANAPNVTPAPGASISPSSKPSPSQTPSPIPQSGYWGCIRGGCVRVPLDNSGNPSCTPVFDNPQCNGNDCSAPTAPNCITPIHPPNPGGPFQ